MATEVGDWARAALVFVALVGVTAFCYVGLLRPTPIPLSVAGAGLDHCGPPLVRDDPKADPASRAICDKYENAARTRLLVAGAIGAAGLGEAAVVLHRQRARHG